MKTKWNNMLVYFRSVRNRRRWGLPLLAMYLISIFGGLLVQHINPLLWKSSWLKIIPATLSVVIIFFALVLKVSDHRYEIEKTEKTNKFIRGE